MPSESSTSSCARCGVLFAGEAPEGAVCESCAGLAAEDYLQTISADTAPPEDGVSTASVSQLNEVIGDYEILVKLGQGGMGAVYRARQLSLGREVALKILPSQFEEDENFVARFQREAQVAARLNHPNLVRVYASGFADGCHFIAMELVEGENLRQRMKRGGLTEMEALRICRDVALALQCGWQAAQLIHRDIKPSNIYLSHAGEVKLGDLGLAKSLLSNTTGVTHTGTTLGTPHYISPEQARGDKVIDFRADIYSLGCTLYELLTGNTPYKATDPAAVVNMHLNAPPPAIMKVLPQCPIALGRVVNKMLRKSKHERHQSYEELIAVMESAMEQLVQPAAGPSAVVAAWKELGGAERSLRPPRAGGSSAAAPVEAPASQPAIPVSPDASTTAPKKRSRVWLAVATTALILAAGAAFMLMRSEKQESTRGPAKRVSKNEPAANSVALPLASAGSVPLPVGIEARAVKLWDSREKVNAISGTGIAWENEALRLDGKAMGPDILARDVILRATVRANPPVSATLETRCPPPGGSGPRCRLSVSPRTGVVLRTAVATEVIGTWPLPRPYATDEWIRVELRTIGNDFTVLIDGQLIGTVHNETVPAPGRVVVYAGNEGGYFRDISYIPLDGLPEAEALKVVGLEATGATAKSTTILPPLPTPRAPSSLPPGAAAPAWVKVPFDSLRLPKETVLQDGWAKIPTGNPSRTLSDPTGQKLVLRNAGLRTTFRNQRDRRVWPQLIVREYNLFLFPGQPDDHARLMIRSGNSELAKAPEDITLEAGKPYTMEFYAIGRTLTGRVNGQTLSYQLPDTAPVEGGNCRFYEFDNDFFRDLEYLPLDGLPEAEALKLARAASLTQSGQDMLRVESSPATATKDAPFINSLGMKFVPVPITGGPTGGQRVLFSIWETRVQDYKAFVDETTRKWSKAGFAQEPSHPAINLTWEDAQAFCAWLTGREHQAGRLPVSERYRLPSDHEWSCAVGIGNQEDAARLPADKSIQIRSVYPWGTEWPPPPHAGNYRGEEEADNMLAGLPVLRGYRDPFPRSAPVGSFPANPLGLFDLGGNVSEWCDDWYDATQQARVHRGGDYSTGGEREMLSDHRGHMEPVRTASGTGFRVVLAPAAP